MLIPCGTVSRHMWSPSSHVKMLGNFSKREGQLVLRDGQLSLLPALELFVRFFWSKLVLWEVFSAKVCFEKEEAGVELWLIEKRVVAAWGALQCIMKSTTCKEHKWKVHCHRHRNLHQLQSWPPGRITWIATCLGLPYWHHRLVLSWFLHPPESHHQQS